MRVSNGPEKSLQRKVGNVMLQTEYEFTLPMGFVDADGDLHREGTMRLATAADEILPLKDPRIKTNPSYLSIVLLSRVVSRLGGVEPITPKTIEALFVADLGYLQDFYNRINRLDGDDPAAGNGGTAGAPSPPGES